MNFPGVHNIEANVANSTSVVDWSPITIMMQYDGGTNPLINGLNEEHKCIMEYIFTTNSIRCVFSTKLNESLFVDYFDDNEQVDLSNWKVRTLCVRERKREREKEREKKRER